MRICFCGDFVSQDVNKIKVDEQLVSLFKSSDYVSLNFEAPIRGYGTPICKSGPCLTQDPNSCSFIKELGINIVQLANNHMMDMGVDGCINTMKSFSSDIIKIGAGNKNDSYSPAVISQDGLSLCLISCTHKEFGTLGVDSDINDVGTAWINHTIINKQIIECKKKYDIVIVLPHAGLEDFDVPLPEWISRYHELIDYGADAVIASHPHVPQGWEIYEGKHIFYSLGNFYFKSWSTNHQEPWYKSRIVELDIDSKKQIKIQVHNAKFTDDSISLCFDENEDKYNEYLCELLDNKNKYEKYLNNKLKKLWPEYKLYLLRGLAAINATSNFHVLSHAVYGMLKGADTPMMLNNFQCESHRWAIERMLNLELNKNRK